MNSKKKIHDKEHIAFEKRYWLRISNICNNCCVFCHDSNSNKDNYFIDKNELYPVIDKAFNDGFKRLILSGGEATIHPDFIEIIKYASETGFNHIQAVTNGRMFAYKSFAQSAVINGLNEATFSIHGHTKKLHDKLTGVEGAYEQALKGIKNLADTGHCIINIDIVINKLNYKNIEDIIKLMSGFGIFEYDLLYLIPFGRAFENKNELFFDINEALPYLKNVFEYSKNPLYHIWTNRLPAQFLENYENLIQDPIKLHDESAGRKLMFENYYKTLNLFCDDKDRCMNCFYYGICNKFKDYFDMINNKNFNKLAFNIYKEDLKVLISSLKKLKILETTHSIFNKKIKSADKTDKLVLRINNIKNISRNSPSNCNNIVYRINHIDNDFFTDNYSGNFMVELNKNNNIIILKNLNLIETSKKKYSFYLPAYIRLSEAEKEYSNVMEVFDNLNAPVYNCALCLNDNGNQEISHDLNYDIINDGKIDLSLLTDEYILNDYYVKSLRCVRCRHNDICRGMHINFIRLFGFKILKEIE